MSSTTLASTKTGVPLPRSSTKSSMASWSNSTSPRTTSRTTVVAVGHAEPQHPAGRRAEAAVTRVAVVALPAGRLRPLLDLLAGEIAVVGLAGGEQLLGGGDVGGGVGALEVRALEHRVVGGDAEPGQRVDDALRPLRPVARLVGVLDAQHEAAAEPPASAQLNSAVRAPPTWKNPVGDGAIRTLTDMGVTTLLAPVIRVLGVRRPHTRHSDRRQHSDGARR